MRQERKEEYRNRVNYKHANFVLRFHVRQCRL
ncbi:hypothetical protein EalM132_00156 [Exiguobacterium phage vB_EalM-132]|nr:hypothetical protein EalM132_00156 [Exiguobacterium phage vB_EalM-132]